MNRFTEFINFFFRCGKDIVTFFDNTIDLGGFSYAQFFVACIVLNVLLGALVVRFTPTPDHFTPGRPPGKSRGAAGSGRSATKEG